MTESPLVHATDWPVARLGDITTKIGSGATPRGGADTYLPERMNYALVRSQNVFDRRFDPNGLAFISDQQAHGLRNAEIQPGDLLLNITGDGVTFARSCAAPDWALPACVNQHVSIIRINNDVADSGYVLAYLTHPGVKPYIESFNSGGSRRAITKGHIESFLLPMPSLSEQRAIAQILGTLDDKIELNRRMSETLEAMARALFKSWFVDFDPVYAKLDGRWRSGESLPGLPAHLFDLFPDRLVPSELGDIPEGWEIVPFGSIVQELRDKVNPLESPDQVFQHFSIPAYDDGMGPKAELGGAIKSQKSLVRPGTILLSKLNPEIPRVWLVAVKEGDLGICSTEFLVLKPVEPFGCSFVYCLCRSWFFRQVIEGLVTGTSKSHQRARPQAIRGINVLKPQPRLLQRFERVVDPMMSRGQVAQRDTQALRDTRGVLLPRLVGGQLKVAGLSQSQIGERA